MKKPQAHDGDYVVMLHGIARSSKCLSRMQKAFEADGYQVLNIDYPSRKQTIPEIVATIRPQIEAFAKDPSKKIHFIGYSMGGLVARAYIHAHRPENLGRMVMLGSPNHGSEVADMLENFPPYKWFYGPAGAQLTTDFNTSSFFKNPDYEVGIVAGTLANDPISYFLIKGPNDGKVSVESTKLDGMKDHVTLPVTHTFMPRTLSVIRAAKSFIKDGAFPRKS